MAGRLPRSTDRQATIGLTAFLAIWYAAELVVLSAHGESLARYLFYYPKTGPAPGAVFAVVSHDLADPLHLVGNVGFLLVVGGYAEPHLGRKRVLGLVLGAGYLSILLANLLAPLSGLWILAGASGGVVALTTYSGLYFRRRVRPIPDSPELDWILPCLLLFTVPLYAATQLFAPTPHTGHLAGGVLGAVWAGIEWRRSGRDFGPPPEAARETDS